MFYFPYYGKIHSFFQFKEPPRHPFPLLWCRGILYLFLLTTSVSKFRNTLYHSLLFQNLNDIIKSWITLRKELFLCHYQKQKLILWNISMLCQMTNMLNLLMDRFSIWLLQERSIKLSWINNQNIWFTIMQKPRKFKLSGVQKFN